MSTHINLVFHLPLYQPNSGHVCLFEKKQVRQWTFLHNKLLLAATLATYASSNHNMALVLFFFRLIFKQMFQLPVVLHDVRQSVLALTKTSSSPSWKERRMLEIIIERAIPLEIHGRLRVSKMFLQKQKLWMCGGGKAILNAHAF